MSDQQQTQRGLMAIVSVTKHPMTHPPRTVATIRLQGGATYDLTEDAWGKRNYEMNIISDFLGDSLYLVINPESPNKRIILVGSEAGAKRLQ